MPDIKIYIKDYEYFKKEKYGFLWVHEYAWWEGGGRLQKKQCSDVVVIKICRAYEGLKKYHRAIFIKLEPPL